MKAITLYQPWATLVAIEAKKIETRSWSTKYRGPLAIHAAKNQPKWSKEVERLPTFKEALYPNGNYLYPWASCGCIVAICLLTECWRIDLGHLLISEQEKVFGNYKPGRYMWFLEFQKKVPPIPAKGKQGLWEWTPPTNF